uniref:ADAM metallopeptidase domain 19 n=1 Tax=Callorhinchus milii TaxID=7868 RepID=A0A4W3KJH4_CALMI
MVPQWLTPGRSKRFISDKEHPARAEIQVRAEGKALVLEITRNEDLLAPNYAETHYSQTGEPQTSYPDHKAHCFYHGNVKGIEHSSVVLSTCKGLRGLIVMSSSLSYVMEPIEDSIDQHLIFRAEHLKMRGGSCGNQHGQSEVNWITGLTSHIRPAHHREKRDLIKDMKYVELYLVADYAEGLAC